MVRTFLRLPADSLDRQLDLAELHGIAPARLHTIPSCPGLTVGSVEIAQPARDESAGDVSP